MRMKKVLIVGGRGNVNQSVVVGIGREGDARRRFDQVTTELP